MSICKCLKECCKCNNWKGKVVYITMAVVVVAIFCHTFMCNV